MCLFSKGLEAHPQLVGAKREMDRQGLSLQELRSGEEPCTALPSEETADGPHGSPQVSLGHLPGRHHQAGRREEAPDIPRC